MNHDPDREYRLQMQAEQRERMDVTAAAGNPAVDAYRLVHRIVRSAPMPDLPTDFAARVVRHAHEREQTGHPVTDTWLLSLALACAAIVGIIFALPILLDSVRASMALADGVPWPMLVTAGLSLVLVAGVDALLGRRRFHVR